MSGRPATPIVCPRCGSTVAADQAWCLTCGAPARTRMRPTPNWRIPIAVIAAIVVAVGGGTVGAFVALTTEDDAPVAPVPPAAVTPPPDPAAQAPAPATPQPTVAAPPTATGTTPAPPAGAPATP